MSFKEFELSILETQKKIARIARIAERVEIHKARNAARMAAQALDKAEQHRQDTINRIAAKRASERAKVLFEESFEGKGKHRKRILTFAHEVRRERARKEWNNQKNAVILTGSKIVPITPRPYGKPSGINTSAILELQSLRERVKTAKEYQKERQKIFLKSRMALQALAFDEDCEVEELIFLASLNPSKAKPTKARAAIEEASACENAARQAAEMVADLADILQQIEF